MLPIRTDEEWRLTTTQWITLSIIGINIFVFFHEMELSEPELQQFILQWGFTPSVAWYGISHFHLHSIFISLVRSLTCQFIHASCMHVAGNMAFLFVLGRNIENELTDHEGCLGLPTYLVWVPYTIFYLTCGVAACVLHTISSPMSTIPAIGASGAVAGIMGAYLITHPKAKITIVLWPLPIILRPTAWILIGFWAVSELLSGWQTLQGVSGGNVAHWAHVGGFAWGVLGGWLYGLRNQGREHWQDEPQKKTC